MRPEQIRRRETEVQYAGAAYFESIIINCQTDATSNAVVAMADRIRNGFPKRIWWIKRLVDALKDARNNSAGHGQMVAKKTLGPLVKVERVTNLLPIIGEL